MAWSLSSGKTSVLWRKRRVFGREDFPQEAALSRKHFEVIEQKGRVFVQDLKSTNGTFIYGQKVKVGEAIEIQVGDTIKVGDTKFTLSAVEDFAPMWIDAGIFLLALVLAFAEPSYAWGMSVGVMGWLLIASVLLISFVTVAAVSNFIMVRLLKKFWTKKTYAIHAGVVLVASLTLHALAMMYADHHWKVGDTIVESKIEYFCMKSFNQDMCVKHVNLCPDCAKQIDRWKRDLIAEKLKAYRPKAGVEQRQPAATK